MTLWRLRLRSRLGWGQHPDVLRVLSAYFFKFSREFAIILTVFLFAFTMFASFVYGHGLRFPPSPNLIRVSVYWEVVVLLFVLAFLLVPAISGRLLARRGAPGIRASVYGRCFAVELDPPDGFYALIGLARESAHWYTLPIEWDSIVVPSSDDYELTVLTATGWVERLRRMGTSAQEVQQPEPTDASIAELTSKAPTHEGRSEATNDEPADSSYAEGEATGDEKHALRHFARHAPLITKATPANIAATAWSSLLTGMISGLGVLVLAWWISVNVRAPMTPDTQAGAIATVIVFLAIGMALVVCGIFMLRVWRRVPLSNQMPTTVSGKIVSWLAYRDIWTPSDARQRKETIIRLQLGTGNTRMFRIPIRFLHRVRQQGAHVEVTITAAERVVDVVRLPPH